MKRSLAKEAVMTSTTSVRGSAERWGPLWGSRPADWAISEQQHVPGYEAALERIALEPGQRVLDIGCGVGVFLGLVADRGAEPFGVDASEALIELARTRVPAADLRVGDMESLPYDDATFDLVTGFTSFFFANDMVAALREAGRVAKPGAPVIIQVWGAHERCSLEAMKEIARPFFPPRPPDAPPDPDFSQPGALEELAVEAGLTPMATFETMWAYTYPNAETLGPRTCRPGGRRSPGRAGARGRHQGRDRRRTRSISHRRRRLQARERVPVSHRATMRE
jgi:SAM-dependent methyltransferase